MNAFIGAWTMTAAAAFLAATAAACGPAPEAPGATATGSSPSAPPTPRAADVADAAYVGTVWTTADGADAPPGTIRIFLADGTLVMDACTETYRLTRWRPMGADGLAWEEDSATVPAQILESTPATLRLRLTLRGGDTRDETYRPARVPFVCPDLR